MHEGVLTESFTVYLSKAPPARLSRTCRSIESKSIGVGQYQHDISESLLARSLGAVVEDAVNAVGVDVNTASVPLLARVSGIAGSLAESIVSHRDQHGPFGSRSELKDVARLGPKAFEQCAGFLRISGGADPLDRSSVHPEAYPVVRRIVDSAGVGVREVIGNSALLSTLNPKQFADERFGIPTVTDIIAELDKPGRDPRPEFKTATFAAGIEKVADLEPGMTLEGVVTNVAAFGAFVDVGVHQDGLVHVSAMCQYGGCTDADAANFEADLGALFPAPPAADAAPGTLATYLTHMPRPSSSGAGCASTSTPATTLPL